MPFCTIGNRDYKTNTPMPKLQSKIIDKSPVHYGWVILVVGTLGIIMSSPGQTYSFSIFIEEFINDLGLSRSLVSTMYAIGTVTGSTALPFIGKQIDKYGNRRMVVVIALAFGIATLYMSFVSNAIMLLVGVIFMRMLGQSSITLVSSNTINQWWVKRRGIILGISTVAAATLGTGLFPNLINRLIPQFGWRMTYVILGIAIWAIMIPIGYFFFREQPELYGKLPDGRTETVSEEAETNDPIEENWTRAEAIRTPAFWIIVFTLGALSMLGTGLTFHIVSIFADNGLSADLAAAVFFPMALTTALFSIPGGWLMDRVKPNYMLFCMMIFLTTTILMSLSITSPQMAIVYGITFGTTNAFGRIISSVIYANYFGRKHLGSISGLAYFLGSTASGLGPILYGVGRDLSGSYWPTLVVSACYPVIMAILVLFMRKPTH